MKRKNVERIIRGIGDYHQESHKEGKGVLSSMEKIPPPRGQSGKFVLN